MCVVVCCVVLCACLLELGTKRAHRFDTYCVGKEAMTALRRTEELLFARHVSRMLRSDEALACKAVAEEEKRAEEGRGKRTRNENTHRYTQVHTGTQVHTHARTHTHTHTNTHGTPPTHTHAHGTTPPPKVPMCHAPCVRHTA